MTFLGNADCRACTSSVMSAYETVYYTTSRYQRYTIWRSETAFLHSACCQRPRTALGPSTHRSRLAGRCRRVARGFVRRIERELPYRSRARVAFGSETRADPVYLAY